MVDETITVLDDPLATLVDTDLAVDDSLLTTSDNPYNPFEQWDEWYAFDVAKGYNTCAYLARVARTSNELTEEDNNEEISRAILSILELNLTGNYLRVTRNDFK